MEELLEIGFLTMALQIKLLFSRVLNGLVLVRDSLIEARAMQAEAHLKHYRRGMDLTAVEPKSLRPDYSRGASKAKMIPAE